MRLTRFEKLIVLKTIFLLRSNVIKLVNWDIWLTSTKFLFNLQSRWSKLLIFKMQSTFFILRLDIFSVYSFVSLINSKDDNSELWLSFNYFKPVSLRIISAELTLFLLISRLYKHVKIPRKSIIFKLILQSFKYAKFLIFARQLISFMRILLLKSNETNFYNLANDYMETKRLLLLISNLVKLDSPDIKSILEISFLWSLS